MTRNKPRLIPATSGEWRRILLTNCAPPPDGVAVFVQHYQAILYNIAQPGSRLLHHYSPTLYIGQGCPLHRPTEKLPHKPLADGGQNSNPLVNGVQVMVLGTLLEPRFPQILPEMLLSFTELEKCGASSGEVQIICEDLHFVPVIHLIIAFWDECSYKSGGFRRQLTYLKARKLDTGYQNISIWTIVPSRGERMRPT